MKTALFINFTSEPFTGYWNGKAKVFAAGQSVYMPDYLAKHFAKHLANRELLKMGKERDTSPKIKIRADGTEYYDNLSFMEVFDQAYKPEADDELAQAEDSIDVAIAVANKNRAKDGKASLPKNEIPPVEVNPRRGAPAQDPNEPQVIVPPADDDDSEESFGSQPKE